MQAALPVICIFGLSSFFSLPALHFFSFIPTHWAPEVPTALHKTPGGDFFFSFYCPSPGKGLPGSASKSLSCCNGAVHPSRKMRNWECTEVKEKASPGKGLPLVLGVLATAGQGHSTSRTTPSSIDHTSREEAGDREGVLEGVAGAGPVPPAPNTRH